jgi:hypothetical protein
MQGVELLGRITIEWAKREPAASWRQNVPALLTEGENDLEKEDLNYAEDDF